MPYDNRKKIIKEIEAIRNNRTLISLFNFDRASSPELLGLTTRFHSELKACLYRILKENNKSNGFDIFLYTRGGDANSVWPIVNLIREFDENFEVLIPFRAHSAGTLFALGAKKIVMTQLAELSPIDPSTGNQFNPIDEMNKQKRLGISVEDLNAYKDFIKQSYGMKDISKSMEDKNILRKHLKELIEKIHPLAIGNVHSVHQLIKRLAENLLSFHSEKNDNLNEMIEQLTVETFSHLHMISRKEALNIFGKNKIKFASEKLENKLDELLRMYEEDFSLRNPFYVSKLFKPTESIKEDVQTKKKDTKENELTKPFRFAGAALESLKWGYLFITEGTITQFSKLQNNVNIQLPPGQPMPLIPGVPVGYNIEITDQKWQLNKGPKGITI